MQVYISAIQEGFIYGLLALGIYISLKILDIPDLTTEGSFGFGEAIEAIMEYERINEIADLFKMFGDATRVKILFSLFDRELSVTEIVEKIGASQTAVSHQLRSLKQSHLVKCRREGKNIIYSLADEHVKIIINCAVEHIEE